MIHTLHVCLSLFVITITSITGNRLRPVYLAILHRVLRLPRGHGSSELDRVMVRLILEPLRKWAIITTCDCAYLEFDLSALGDDRTNIDYTIYFFFM